MTENAIYNYIRERNREDFRMRYALNQDERRQLVKEVGTNGLVLFEYYLRMASVGTVELGDDDKAADYFGWTTHTARRWRQQLSKTGWYHSERATLPSGKRTYVYYLGKEQVAAAKAN